MESPQTTRKIPRSTPCPLPSPSMKCTLSRMYTLEQTVEREIDGAYFQCLIKRVDALTVDVFFPDTKVLEVNVPLEEIRAVAKGVAKEVAKEPPPASSNTPLWLVASQQNLEKSEKALSQASKNIEVASRLVARTTAVENEHKSSTKSINNTLRIARETLNNSLVLSDFRSENLPKNFRSQLPRNLSIL